MRVPHLTIAEKLTLAFVAVFSVPLFALALYFGWRFEQDLRDKAVDGVRDRLERTAELVGRKLEVLESVASMLSGYKALLDYTARPGTPTSEDLLQVKELLVMVDRIQALNPDIVRTRMFLSNPDWPEVWPFVYSEKRVTEFPWHKAVSRRQTRWRIGHWDDLTFLVDTMSRRDLLVSLFKPLQDPYGAPLGSLQVSTTVPVFFNGLVEAGESIPTAAVWVTAEGPVRDFWGRKLPPSLTNAPGRLSAEEGSEGLLPGQNGPAVAWKRLPHLGAVLLAEVPRAATETLVPLQWTLAGASLGVLALAALVISLGTRFILRRLRTVSAAVLQVRQGNLDVDLAVAGDDEVSDLAQTFASLLDRLKALVDRLVREQVASKDAEIRALQSQINAHFLYNALESIRMTAFVDGQDRVADALAALGRTLRYGMDWSRPIVTLADEVGHAEAYIVLWNLRFGGGIEWIVELNPRWLSAPLVKFAIQPLVENAVIHGLGPRGNRGRVKLDGRIENEGLVLSVRDDGEGLSQEGWAEVRRQFEGTVQPARAPIGLANVHERLRAAFGPRSGLILEGSANGWTTVSLWIPFEGDAE